MPLDGEQDPLLSSAVPPPHAEPHPPTAAERAMAVLEVVICSDYPTQLALGATFAALGFGPLTGGQLNLTFVVLVSLVDTVLLLGLIAIFLSIHGERPHELFLGRRPIAAEVRAGIPLTLVALTLAVGVLLAIQQFAPWLH